MNRFKNPLTFWRNMFKFHLRALSIMLIFIRWGYLKKINQVG